MNIYLAGPWADKERVAEVAEELRAAGHTISREWWKFEAGDEEHDKLCELAIEDADAVFDCDVMVVWNGRKSEGKAFEQGLAWGEGIPIVVIGPIYNIFQHMPDFMVVQTVKEAIDVLSELRL